MFKILVPTDFSPIADRAAEFAGIIAGKMNDVQITLFHCIDTSDTGRMIGEKVEDILVKEAETGLRKSAEKLKFKENIQTDVDLAFGDYLKNLLKKTESLPADLIVMGTHGAGGIEKIFFGSNAAITAEKTTACPVLIVPPETELKVPRKLIYATDMADLQGESAIVAAFAKLLGAHLEVLHINDKKEKFSDADTHIAHSLMKENNYSKISFKEADNWDILSEIEYSTNEDKAHMVIMFSRQKTLFERVFDRSFTKEMAFHTRVPLMIIPYELVL
jgi:nucleotide-binding universal stress UspA family protein